jgi:dUTP pyrophosphatase
LSTTKAVRVKTLEHFKGELPRYETSHASGVDVRAQLFESITIAPQTIVVVPTGLTVEIPSGFEIQVRPRSGWAIRDGLTVVNSPGTIDADYRGEIKIGLINLGSKTLTINDQDRVAQLVLCPVLQIQWEKVSELGSTQRDAGGFGSTGRN